MTWFAGAAVVEVVCWASAGSVFERLLLARGQRHTETATAFGYRILADAHPSPRLSLADWWITMGDSDVF